MRRVFIIRKDLHLTPGKLAAMVSHCAEAYWTKQIIKQLKQAKESNALEDNGNELSFMLFFSLRKDIVDEYISKIFTKTICECKSKADLKKAAAVANSLKLVEDEDYGYINDSCKTELTPENDDGTCTVGMWFRPLEDDIAHKISKKFKLYGVFDAQRRNCDVYTSISEARNAFEKSIDSLRMHFDEWLYAPFNSISSIKTK